MPKIGIYEILDTVGNQPTRQGKIDELRRHRDNQVLTLLLKMAYDPGLKWKLPPGPPPYRPSTSDQTGMLYSEMRRFYVFLDDPRSAKVSQPKREKLFIELLEALHPRDAQIVVGVKDKKLPVKGLTEKIVDEAFPGLLR